MGEHDAVSKPSAWVSRFAPLVMAGGPVLDLACGGGRHTRLFLECGHPVTALDRDVSQVRGSGAEAVAADLEDGSPWPLGDRRFAAIIITHYLWRPLFPLIRAALAPGGVLIHETFALGNEVFGRPRNPDFLLRPGELLGAYDGLTIVAYEHGQSGQAVMQRLCAVDRSSPQSLGS